MSISTLRYTSLSIRLILPDHFICAAQVVFK